MGDYLFNQNILILLSAWTTLLVFGYGHSLAKTGWQGKRLLTVAALDALLYVAIVQVVRAQFSLTNLPTAGYYLVFLLTTLALLNGCYFWRLSWRGRSLGLAAVLSSLLLIAASINSFYQFYPTVAAIFSTAPRSYSNRSLVVASGNLHTLRAGTILETRLFPQPAAQGTIYTVPIPGEASGFRARPALVYLPPAYNQYAANNLFPVLVLLPGIPGSPSDWLHGGNFASTMDSFAARHHGITPIVVLADQNGTFNNDTECVNSSRGNVETYLTVDVPAYIKRHFHAATAAANWAIGGDSEGGMCGAMLTLRHQDVYRHFLDMAGDPLPYLNNLAATLPVLFNGSRTAQQQHNIDWLLQHVPKDSGLTGQFLIGSDDSRKLRNELRHTYDLAVAHGVPASYQVIPRGGHDFATWSRAYQSALPVISYYLGATSCEGGCSR